MPETAVVSTELTSQYATQLTNDIDRNAKEQERISAEITDLQQKLTTLQHDHTALVNMRHALGVQSATTGPAATPRSPAVPAVGKKTAGQQDTKERAGAKRGTASPARAAAKTAKASAGKAGKTDQPTLVELVRRHLTRLGEPRSAAEIATALGQAHPERGIKTTVVRTTLEGLVAKNHAQRTKQGSSVFYTAPETAEQTAPQGEAQAEQAE
ncbi:hypothetical protein AB5J72_51480 (plasmid) [Streptomyces sp. CG1]|uniref:hypothetical protein n=1 Tax=Streptomyces sp. CG1 TaxID=1287523 RepID=UPI0034E2FE56